jgi:hypothetical protein
MKTDQGEEMVLVLQDKTGLIGAHAVMHVSMYQAQNLYITK